MGLDGCPLTGRCCRPVSVHKTRFARIAYFRRNGRGFGRFAMAIMKIFSVMMPTAHSVRAARSCCHPLVPEFQMLIEEVPADRFVFIHAIDQPFKSAASFGNSA
jgi:hypothetical protein